MSRLALSISVAILAAGCCRSPSDAAANARARQEAAERARDAPPPLPKPAPAPAPDLSKLTTAKMIASVLDGSAKPTKSKAAAGVVTTSYAALPGAEAIAEKGSPAHARIRLPTLPPEGLGPSERVCKEGDDEWFRLTAGPLAGRFLGKSPEGFAYISTESFLRRYEKGCAIEASCRSGRSLAHAIPPNVVLAAACHATLLQILKAPKQAEFPDIGEETIVVGKDCYAGLASHVDAMNPYGVKLRTKYACAWDPATDRTTVQVLDQ